ncbi:hypothetical protein QFZ66_008399 [Streptomyces sp. B4I13]|uniref:M36 family metallopeptidase n=1 Tax=Streptomyces sp. B4I13 TaxID=3042271 RepID=UPI0027875143|nr:M36 family metallopeptidase [Streptomyces sp. B4I13]MDQ0964521.1 hypothetical protein [Streptomyces sp. B4I13]
MPPVQPRLLPDASAWLLHGALEHEHTVVGDWVVADARGIRQRPYDDQYPGDFGKIGQLAAGLDYTKIHNVGEIWCAALVEMTRRISSNVGCRAGSLLPPDEDGPYGTRIEVPAV